MPVYVVRWGGRFAFGGLSAPTAKYASVIVGSGADVRHRMNLSKEGWGRNYGRNPSKGCGDSKTPEKIRVYGLGVK